VKQPDIEAVAPIGSFDLESAKAFFHDWWRAENEREGGEG